MKTDFDKEIDSLLRRRHAASRGAHGPATPGARQASAHPDADELSAYAENALPQVARALYVAHLADCEECRKIVTGIALAAEAGGVRRTAASTAEAAPVAGWRARLAALFAPRTLRFVMPALALSLVAVVTYVALRSGGDSALVAERAPAVGERRADARRGADANLATATTTTTNSAPVTATNAAAPAAQGAPSFNAQPGEPGRAGATTALSKTADAPGRGAPGRRGEQDTPRDTFADAAPAAAPAAPPPAVKEEVSVGAGGPPAAAETAARLKAAQREDAARRQDEDVLAVNNQYQNRQLGANRNEVAQQQRAPDGARAETRSKTNYSGGAPAPRLAPSTPQAEQGGGEAKARKRSGAASRAAGKADEDANKDEMRGAGGHRFRRQGGAWVDVDYRPSMPMTGVRRGTDQYRALVADIPELGRIAEQLGGEVIVALGGKAYRIR